MPPLLSANNLSRRFGPDFLFDGISISLEAGERVALIGSNGSGKTTLLKMLARAVDPDSGNVVWRSDLRIVHVPQSDTFQEGGTALSECLLLAHNPTDERTLARVFKLLARHGFSDPDALVTSFSGGQKKRLAIVRALCAEPEVLLLDEPTNHLDIDGVFWIEEVLKNLKAGVIFISHDRAFIDSVGTRVIELDRAYPKGFITFDGGYERFAEARAQFLEQRASERDALANRVRREVAWLRRGPSAQRTKAKSRIRDAHSMIEELSEFRLDTRKAGIEITASERKTHQLVKGENVGFTIQGKQLFGGLNFILSPGTRLGVIGPNGCGKSSFLSVISGRTRPTSGTVKFAPELRIVHIDQYRSSLNLDAPLRNALAENGDQVIFNGKAQHVAGWAERFLFRRDQLGLPLRSLSGGEQARAALARIMVEPADVLILDEPTNDLDIPTLEVLEETLCQFAGALVVVSHDRYLLGGVATQVLGFVGNGEAEFFADWDQWRESLIIAPRDGKTPSRSSFTEADARELHKLEKKIQSTEARIAKLEAELSEPSISNDSEKLTALCQKIGVAREELDALMRQWESLEEKRSISPG